MRLRMRVLVLSLALVSACGERPSGEGRQQLSMDHGVSGLVLLDSSARKAFWAEPGADWEDASLVLPAVEALDVLPDGMAAYVVGDKHWDPATGDGPRPGRAVRGRVVPGGKMNVEVEVPLTACPHDLVLSPPSGHRAIACWSPLGSDEESLFLIDFGARQEAWDLVRGTSDEPQGSAEGRASIFHRPSWDNDGNRIACYWHAYPRARPDYEKGGFSAIVLEVKSGTPAVIGPRSNHFPTRLASRWNPDPRERPLWSHDDGFLLIDGAYGDWTGAPEGAFFYGSFVVSADGKTVRPFDARGEGMLAYWCPWDKKEFVCYEPSGRGGRIVHFSATGARSEVHSSDRLKWIKPFKRSLLVCEGSDAAGMNMLKLWAPDRGWSEELARIPDRIGRDEVFPVALRGEFR